MTTPTDRGTRLARRLGSAGARRRRHRRVAAAAAVLLVTAGALVLAGGRSDPSFRDEAGAVCDASFDDIGTAQAALLPAGGAAGVEAQVGFVAGAYVDLLRERIVELRALEAPDEDAARFAELLADYEVVLDAIVDDPDSVVRAGGDGVDPFAEVDADFDAFGLVACGSRRPG